MPTARLSRRVSAALTERLGYKAAALFFAGALWLVASGEEPGARYVTVRVVPVLDESLRLVGDAPTVRAYVAGPTRELLKLYATPPAVRRVFGPGTPDDVRVELRPSDVDLPAGASRLVVRDVSPRAIALRFRTARPPAPAAPGVSITPAGGDAAARPLDSVRLTPR